MNRKEWLALLGQCSIIGEMTSVEVHPTVFEAKHITGLFEQPSIDLMSVVRQRRGSEEKAEGKIFLYGDWIVQPNGKYIPNAQGKLAVVYDRILKIVKVFFSSDSLIRCTRFEGSPMAIGEMPGDSLGYALPPEFYEEEWMQKNADRFLVGGKPYSFLKHTMLQNTRKIEKNLREENLTKNGT